MKLFSLVIFFILFICSEAIAHGLYLASREGKLHAYFSDKSPASNAVLIVVDMDGIEILRDTLDERGNWIIPQQDIDDEPYMVVVEAGGGHRAQLTWQEALQGTANGFFDNFIVRIIAGIAIIFGIIFVTKRYLI
ncbi:MAG: hypothetical protein ACUBOA_12665 [Candidatus Loosdrechtia sp.]|uniref:hypothetical protein n=1 Tax=Candidatus Loosdrechtia sp. TaxID=3101272 RepID=UPI003A718183|nr:MAG: hypothetical protein QY305_12055 [Candidatus Jettenia sp. AMX2]